MIEPKKKLRVLIACEESQVVCKAFRERGHEAFSCDILQCSGGHPEWHLTGDVKKLIHPSRQWDLIIAHPPCTKMANSGVQWLEKRNQWADLYDACQFFTYFRIIHQLHKIPICIENPIPHKYAKEIIGNYTQIIQPWQFGHGEQKATCLWLYGLPPLKPTEIVDGREQRIWKLPPTEDRSKLRSKTYPGIAKAMAEQWG